MEEQRANRFGWLKIIVAIILTAIVTYSVTRYMTQKELLNSTGITYLTAKMNTVKEKLNDAYIYDLDEDKMIESAIKGYVEGVDDQYTEYLTADEMESLIQSTNGSYVGIGVYIGDNKADDNIVIIGVIKDSSAQDAGLKAGDIIYSIDGVEYKSGELTKASNALKGKEEGTEVKVTVIRDSEKMDFYVVRKNIKLKSVYSEKLDNGIGYINITTFSSDTSNEFKEAYSNLKNEEINSLVLDLRNNGGGLVSEALKIANYMVTKGSTTLITYNKANKEGKQKSYSDPIVDVPVIILVNENSASASEILAGCLRDNCKYKIVGTTSYGKGVIQTVFSFQDGSGMKITTEEYFTPNKNKINNIGIKPDIEVENDEKWDNVSGIPLDEDLQLKKAIEEISK